MLVGLAAAALAARVTESEMQGWLDELVPLVEQETGRTFRVRPTLALDTRAGAQRRADEARAAAARVGLVTPEQPIPPEFLAFYTTADLRIYVLRDAIERLFERTAADDRLLAPFLRCAVLHELTHALQHQRARIPLNRWDDPVARALMEGQAALVARRRCGDALAADFGDSLVHADIVSSVDPADPIAFAYSYGSRYVERLVAGGGHDLVWARFADLPSSEEVVAAVEETLLPDWGDPAPLVAVTDLLVPEGRQVHVGALSPTDFLGASLAGGIDPAFILRGAGGLASQVESWSAVGAAYLFRLADPADVTRWMAARREAVHDGTAWLFAPNPVVVGRSPFTRSRRLAKAGVDETLVVRLRFADGRYREVWAARDGVLAGTTLWKLGRHPDVVASVAALVHEHQGPIPPVLPLPGSAAGADDPTAVGGRYAVDRMLVAYRGGDLVGCSSLGDQLAPEVERGTRAVVVAIAYECAQDSGDVAVADAWLPHPDFHPSFRYAGRHLQWHYDGEDWASALAVLERTVASDEEERRDRATYELDLRLRLAHADAAEVLARTDLPDPDLRVVTAAWLHGLGRREAARTIAAAACPLATASIREAGHCPTP